MAETTTRGDRIATVEVAILDDEAARQRRDDVVIEEPLELRVHDESIAVVMRTPGHDDELACGFAVTEGIAVPSDVHHATHCRRVGPGLRNNVINIMLREHVVVDFDRLRRNMYAGSSCGVCGKATIDAVFVEAAPLAAAKHRVRPDDVQLAIAEMSAGQAVFAATGGLHAAALFRLDQRRTVVIREDVGRHNAVDKVIGERVLKGKLPLCDHLLVVSGRAGFEIVQKALVAGIGAVASISAPSSLAVDLARRANMLLVGFARGNSLNVYSGAHRLDEVI